MESTSHDIGIRTQFCLSQIKQRASNEPAKVLAILGRNGAGKSTLLEDLTGAQGHARDVADSGTAVVQFEETIIDGEQYFFMDAPGFGAGDDLEVLLKITRAMDGIRRHATIAGVLFVASVNDSLDENLERKLLEFLGLFCGDEYIPRITFVTTQWNRSNDSQSNRFAQLRSLWCSFLASGASLYQHGRKYNDQHEDAGICLPWPSSRGRIAEYSRYMVSRHYGAANGPALRILRELEDGTEIHLTSAAQCFRTSPNQGTGPEGMPSRDKTTPEQSGPRPEPRGKGDPNEHVPSANADRLHAVWNKIADTAFNIGLDLVCDALQSKFGGSGINPRTPGPRSVSGTVLRRTDPDSLVDICKGMDLPSDLASRQTLGAKYGIFNVGTAEGNVALLKELTGRR